jgi:hypothetical protein
MVAVIASMYTIYIEQVAHGGISFDLSHASETTSIEQMNTENEPLDAYVLLTTGHSSAGVRARIVQSSVPIDNGTLHT